MEISTKMHLLELSTMIRVVKADKMEESINIWQGDTLHEEKSSCGNRTTNKIMCIHDKGANVRHFTKVWVCHKIDILLIFIRLDSTEAKMKNFVVLLMVAFIVAGLQVADTRKLRSPKFMAKDRRAGPAAVSAGSLDERSQFIYRRVPCSNKDGPCETSDDCCSTAAICSGYYPSDPKTCFIY